MYESDHIPSGAWFAARARERDAVIQAMAWARAFIKRRLERSEAHAFWDESTTRALAAAALYLSATAKTPIAGDEISLGELREFTLTRRNARQRMIAAFKRLSYCTVEATDCDDVAGEAASIATFMDAAFQGAVDVRIFIGAVGQELDGMADRHRDFVFITLGHCLWNDEIALEAIPEPLRFGRTVVVDPKAETWARTAGWRRDVAAVRLDEAPTGIDRATVDSCPLEVERHLERAVSGATTFGKILNNLVRGSWWALKWTIPAYATATLLLEKWANPPSVPEPLAIPIAQLSSHVASHVDASAGTLMATIVQLLPPSLEEALATWAILLLAWCVYRGLEVDYR